MNDKMHLVVGLAVGVGITSVAALALMPSAPTYVLNAPPTLASVQTAPAKIDMQAQVSSLGLGYGGTLVVGLNDDSTCINPAWNDDGTADIEVGTTVRVTGTLRRKEYSTWHIENCKLKAVERAQ